MITPGIGSVAEMGGAPEWRMMFAGNELKLALVTVHMGLKTERC